MSRSSNKVSRFLLIVLISLSLTRIWSVSLFYIFGRDSLFMERIVNDPWHHYQVGLALTILACLLRKWRNRNGLLAIGLGIFLEEWPVFLNDLGLPTIHFYHSKFDFILAFSLIGAMYTCFKIASILDLKITQKTVQ